MMLHKHNRRKLARTAVIAAVLIGGTGVRGTAQNFADDDVVSRLVNEQLQLRDHRIVDLNLPLTADRAFVTDITIDGQDY